MNKLTTADEPTWWHSSPILIAVVPAIAALYHPNGGTIATDIVLLLLGAWFMQKCCAVPWEWYHDAQQQQYADGFAYSDTIHEEGEDSMPGSPERPDSADDSTDDLKGPIKPSAPPIADAHDAARKALRRTEMMAFFACFLGPLLGAYVLHTIRSQFTHESQDRIVTDMNLTICVLLAEMRPLSRLIQMNKERTLHLQRIVNSPVSDSSYAGNTHGLEQRLAALEARYDGPRPDNNIDATKIAAQVRQSMQRQIDDLYGAVRRYEKKFIAQSIQLEARFDRIDMGMKDTLSLAAAAARSGQKPGIISVGLNWIASIFVFGLQLGWDVAAYPFRLTNTFLAMVSSSMSTDPRSSRKRSKAQLNGYAPTPRMQSRSGR